MNIYDLAAKAGVSIATVSRVLNGSDKVKPETRKRIEQLIEENGYTRFDPHARRKSTMCIGYICVSLSMHEGATLAEMISRNLAAHGYRMILCSTAGDLTNLHYAIESLSKQTDALIIEAGAFSDIPQTERSTIMRIGKTTPIMLLNERIDSKGVYSLFYDQPGQISKLVSNYLSHGKDQLMFIFSSMSIQHLRILDSFKQSYEMEQLELQSEYMHLCPSEEAAFSYMKEFLENNKTPQAIITTNRELSWGIQQALFYSNLSPETPIHCTECKNLNVIEVLSKSLLQVLDSKETPTSIIIPGALS